MGEEAASHTQAIGVRRRSTLVGDRGGAPSGLLSAPLAGAGSSAVDEGGVDSNSFSDWVHHPIHLLGFIKSRSPS
jgi:hypothetical protein